MEEETIKRGDNLLVKKLSEKQQELVNKRLFEQMKKMKDIEEKRERKRVRHIRTILPHVSYEEAKMALDDCNSYEEEAIDHLSDLSNLLEIRKVIALKASSAPSASISSGSPTSSIIIHESGQRRNQHSSIRRQSDSSEIILHRPRTRKGQRIYPKLRLDEALARPNMEGWSEARKRAYVQRESNPNAYYYRFNDPGEPQKNGKWSDHEKKIFLDLIAKKGVDGQWGIFSRSIPGRVGYQCSNFYRHLIKEGEIEDPKYVFDKNGKLGYLFSSKTMDGEQDPSVAPLSSSPSSLSPSSLSSSTSLSSVPLSSSKRIRVQRKKTIGKKRRNADYEDDGDEDDEYIPCGSLREKNFEDDNKIMAQISNPLPDFIDPITLEPVENPMISANGIVMGRATWSRCLSQTPPNICPLTKVTVHKRDLVLLTPDNIHLYKDKIVNSNYI